MRHRIIAGTQAIMMYHFVFRTPNFFTASSIPYQSLPITLSHE